MAEDVHILVTCRIPELVRASTLVFDTIRVGFPDSKITVWFNDGVGALPIPARVYAIDRADRCFTTTTTHPKWIESLIDHATEPFWIIDTDVCFWKEMIFDPNGVHALAGRKVPAFACLVTGCLTQERLHTAVMRIDPVLFREHSETALKRLNPNTPFFSAPSLVAPVTFTFKPQIGLPRWHFHDTLSQAYRVFGGEAFKEETLDCYDHINAGTYAELVDNKIPGFKYRVLKYLDNPETLRGRWREEEKWYAEHAP